MAESEREEKPGRKQGQEKPGRKENIGATDYPFFFAEGKTAACHYLLPTHITTPQNRITIRPIHTTPIFYPEITSCCHYYPNTKPDLAADQNKGAKIRVPK